MGKRSRRQKKEESLNPVPDKSPKMASDKPCFSELQSGNKELFRSPTKDDRTNKITSYFPRSPESGKIPVGASKAAAVAENEAAAANKQVELLAKDDFLLPQGLLTPETTPTKELLPPHSRPHQYPHPSPPPQPHQSPDAPLNHSDRGERPRAAHKLEYENANKTTDENLQDGDLGARENGEEKNEVRKSNKKGRERSKKPKQVTGKPLKPVQSAPATTLKDYFPVRRSNRKCKSAIKAEEAKRVNDAVLSGKEEGLEVQDILGKGRGVIATKPFSKGEFVIEYYGNHIDITTAKEREQEYATNPSIGCYMYYYRYKNKSYCVDATAESDRIGRLINHSKSGNCTTKLISIEDRPYLILVASRSISLGEELVYDYGDRNKESLQSHPWLAL